MKKFFTLLAALLFVGMSASAKTLECNLSALPAASENTTWDAETNTFAWSAGSYNSTEIFGAGDYSEYETLNISSEAGNADHFRIIFKFTNGAAQVTKNPVMVGNVSLTWEELGVSEENVKNISTIRISGANDVAASAEEPATIILKSISLEGPDVKVYKPISLYPQQGVEVSKLTGTNANWASSVSYPKEFAVQGASFGDGDGSNESTHVNVEDYDQISFVVSQGSTGLGLRVWMWNGSGVTTLYAYPEAEAETADFTQPYKITAPGIYVVKFNGLKYLKGVKAANDWGASALKVSYAYVTKAGQNLAVNEARTFSSSECLDFSEVTDVDAYIAVDLIPGDESDKLEMKKITGSVPANTGLVLVQKSEKSVISIPTCEEGTEDVSANVLAATTEETTLEFDGSMIYYVLAGSGENLAWYMVYDEPATLAAGKSYIAYPMGGIGYTKSLKMSFGEETAIQSVSSNKETEAIYNLNGQRVSQAQKGLYIVNGKKVLF